MVQRPQCTRSLWDSTSYRWISKHVEYAVLNSFRHIDFDERHEKVPLDTSSLHGARLDDIPCCKQLTFTLNHIFSQAFNLYWATSSSVQLIVLLSFRFHWFKEFMGVPEFLPGSKLERQNKKIKVDNMAWNNPDTATKIYSHPPSKQKVTAKKKHMKALSKK